MAEVSVLHRQNIAQAKNPVVLVCHSYGGVVITEAGNNPKVSKLVVIAAFASDNLATG